MVKVREGGLEPRLGGGQVSPEMLSLLAEHAGQYVLGAKLVVLKNQQVHREEQILLQVRQRGRRLSCASSGRKGF